MIGQQISHYIVKRKLGAGTYGVVYAAEHQADPELVVAIKVVQPSLIEDPKFVAALKAECRRLDKLDHHAIVRFRDLVVGEDMVAMILEHLDGQDLHDFIRAGAVPFARTVDILEACLDGLTYAHSRQVIHRDIKPSNIFVCNDGRIKLLDFGMARAAQGSQATQTGTLKGTLDYMAPERFSAKGGGPHSDVYALGLVAWELLTGRAACPDGDLAAKLGWHLGVGATDVRLVRPDVPDWLAEVVQLLAAKDPADRPPDAAAAKALFTERRAPISAPAAWHAAPIPSAPRTVALDAKTVADAVAEVGRRSTPEPVTEDGGEPDEDHLAAVITVMPPEPVPSPAKHAEKKPTGQPAAVAPAPVTPVLPKPKSRARTSKGLRWVLGCSVVGVLGCVAVVVVSLVGLLDSNVSWVQQVKCAGWGEGCFNLGVMYEDGEGVPKDTARAAKLYEQACTGGDAKGCSNLGVLYNDGEGVPKDDARAAKLFEQACTGGDAKGCSNLGVLYNDGEGVPKDDARAAKLFEQACTGGYAKGCANLGWMYDKGRGVPKDAARAAKLYEQACTGGNARGCHNLGLLYNDGEGVPKDDARAAKLYEQACTGGYARGCHNLGWMYGTGRGVPKDAARAAKLYEQACTGGNAGGCNNLGLLYKKGEGVPKDDARAVELFEQACTGGYATGCYNLAVLYQNGEGVPKDRAQEKRYVGKACDLGFERACKSK